MICALPELEPGAYTSHPLHGSDRAWTESNCYVDLWIELVHALKLDPVPALAFTLGLDFEADQWLFFKHPLADLYDLYGIDVQELAIWRPLREHCREQVSRGAIVVVEVDAYHLPDTRGVSYQVAHSKTTIGVERIDENAKELGYFHNAGYFTLKGSDFEALFRPLAPSELAPYTEFAKLGRVRRLSERELVQSSVALFRKHLARAPRDNPFPRFAANLQAELGRLSEREPALFHAYAFTTFRQCGACSELAASYLRWLEAHGVEAVSEPALRFDAIAEAAKALQLGAARAVLRKRPLDVESAVSSMGRDWAAALEMLQGRHLG